MNRHCTLTVVLATVMSACPVLRGDEPIIHVASDFSLRTDPVTGGLDYDSSTSGTSISNYVCESFDDGCRKPTTKIGNDGNIVGCGSGCTGSCTVCDGLLSPAATLCVKSPVGNCVSSTNWVVCGKKATGTCVTAPPGGGDNRGCDCTPPPIYSTVNSPKIRTCLPETRSP